MAALGRILQVVGWLWVIAGLVGPALGFWDLSFIPGVVVVFLARILRTQAERRELPDLDRREETEEATQPPPARLMNTERQRLEQQARPQPAMIEHEPMSDPEPIGQPTSKRNQLLDQIVTAGREVEEEMSAPQREDRAEPVDAPDTPKPMSSDEMIARARKRWDSKPR